ncbi:putative bifunctional diguanylate cyclase/phosphodiesterase [Acidihalobacter aeolianus]|nr:EAL domain-containing protein [Acidihalobacter aeolianus]
MSNRNSTSTRPLRMTALIIALAAVIVAYGALSWLATRQTIARDLTNRAQQYADAEMRSLEHWASTLQAFGNLLMLDNDTRATQLDTRIVLFQSAYPNTPLPLFIFQAQDHRLLGASPALFARKAVYRKLAVQTCHFNAGQNLMITPPRPLPDKVFRGERKALPMCVSIRDAGGDSMLDIVALLPWPMRHPRRDFSTQIAGESPVFKLLWQKPDTTGSLLPAGMRLMPDHLEQGSELTHGRMMAWCQIADFPFVVEASVSQKAVWHEWLLHGGAGEGFVLLMLLAGALGVNARRSSALAQTEAQLRRYYSTLKDINQALVSTPDPTALYNTVCTHLVNGAHLPLAWIGTELDGVVGARAVSGAARGYVDDLELDLHPDSPSIHGPVGQALRERTTVVLSDLQNDARFANWRERATRYALSSLVAVPFTSNSGVRGVLIAYARVRNFFTPALIQLMEELVSNIELGLNQFDRVAEVTRLSQQDPLTGLPNRAYFMHALGQALARGDRAERLTAIGILDLDYFKQVNDSLGHLVGDQMLKHLADTLVGAVRQGDTVARLGGDEFGILLENVAGTEELETIANRLLSAVRKPFMLTGLDHELQSDASLGFTLYPLDEGSPADLLRHADAALYAAKGAGRHHWRLFGREMARLAKREYLIHQQLPTAISGSEIFLHFQPQIDLSDGSIIGAEALVRWQHPSMGLWSPQAFIPTVEADVGLARQLGIFLLQSTAHHITRWHADGHDFGRLSVNICARHLQHSCFLDDLDEVLERYPEAASHLTLELTETNALSDLDKSARILSEVRNRGIRVALDDFGSGYASLQYVRELPLDVIKLDLQFVQNLERDTEAFAVGYAALTLAEIRGATVVAEGVENQRTADLWRRLGGHAVQGYLFAKPLSEQDWLAWLQGYEPTVRQPTIPRWRPTQETLSLLQALPHHNQLVYRLRTMLRDDIPPDTESAELHAAWLMPCPLTEWLASPHAAALDTAPLNQAHHRLHQTAVTLLTAPIRSTDGLLELDETWRNFVDALDATVEQVDRRLSRSD